MTIEDEIKRMSDNVEQKTREQKTREQKTREQKTSEDPIDDNKTADDSDDDGDRTLVDNQQEDPLDDIKTMADDESSDSDSDDPQYAEDYYGEQADDHNEYKNYGSHAQADDHNEYKNYGSHAQDDDHNEYNNYGSHAQDDDHNEYNNYGSHAQDDDHNEYKNDAHNEQPGNRLSQLVNAAPLLSENKSDFSFLLNLLGDEDEITGIRIYDEHDRNDLPPTNDLGASNYMGAIGTYHDLQPSNIIPVGRHSQLRQPLEQKQTEQKTNIIPTQHQLHPRILQISNQRRIINNTHRSGMYGVPCPERGVTEEAKAILLRCAICQSNQVQTVNFPCMHACFCLDCAGPAVQQSNICPQCRTAYMHVSMLYLCYKDADDDDIKHNNKRRRLE